MSTIKIERARLSTHRRSRHRTNRIESNRNVRAQQINQSRKKKINNKFTVEIKISDMHNTNRHTHKKTYGKFDIDEMSIIKITTLRTKLNNSLR